MTTAADVAKWMMSELEKEGILDQESAVGDIEQKFGSAFVYENQNGNLAISKDVLSEFRKLTEDIVVWVRSDRCWRFREKYDDPGRRQD